MFTERTRAYVYRVALAALFVAGGYDVLTDDQVMLWTALVAAVLAVPLAVANTSTTTEG